MKKTTLPTEFGKMLRKIRIDFSEKQFDMACTLGITSTFLSYIETGQKNVPAGICEKIAEIYELDSRWLGALKRAAFSSDLDRCAIRLGRKYDGLTEIGRECARDIMYKSIKF